MNLRQTIACALSAAAVCACFPRGVAAQDAAGEAASDPAMQEELYRLVTSLRQEEGMGILMVSHDLHAAVTHATHVLHMAEPPFWGTREAYLNRKQPVEQEGEKQ